MNPKWKKILFAIVVWLFGTGYVLAQSSDIVKNNNEKPLNGDIKTNPPLPNQASGEEVWRRVIELLKVPHGLVTADEVQAAFGDSLNYSHKSPYGYTASSGDTRNKNYYVMVIYLYQAMDKRYLIGPQSTAQISLPTSDCLTVDQVEKDLLDQGMHFLGAHSLPSTPSRIYAYPDNNGSIEIIYDFIRNRAADDLKNVCTRSLTIRGYVKSS